MNILISMINGYFTSSNNGLDTNLSGIRQCRHRTESCNSNRSCLSYDQHDITESNIDSYYDTDYVFDYSQGFNVAVAFSNFSSKRSDLDRFTLNPSIGSLVFSTAYWGVDDNGNTLGSKIELESHACTAEQLGLTTTTPSTKNDDEDVENPTVSKFMPIH